MYMQYHAQMLDYVIPTIQCDWVIRLVNRAYSDNLYRYSLASTHSYQKSIIIIIIKSKMLSVHLVSHPSSQAKLGGGKGAIWGNPPPPPKKPPWTKKKKL